MFSNRISKLFARFQAPTHAQSERQVFAVESLDARQHLSASFDIGINVNDSSSTFMSKSVAELKIQGVKTVRMWTSVNFDERVFSGGMSRSIDYARAGFDVMLIINPKDGYMPSSGSIKGWFNWALSNDSLRSAVDRWQVGNEVDRREYWKGSLPQYVNNFLKPASEVIRSYGEEVVSSGVSWNPLDVKEMIDVGMLNHADYVGYHPYGTLKQVKQRVVQINQVVAGRKPIVASEWNVRGFESGSRTEWAKAVEEVYPLIKGSFAINYYFASKKTDAPAGPGGILNPDGTRNTPFYNAFTTFRGVTVAPPPPPIDGGNTPSTNGGIISGLLWNDTDGDKVKDASESVVTQQTVYIDTNANARLDAGERNTITSTTGTYNFTGLIAGNYNVSRVLPTGFKLSNGTTATYLSTNVAVNQRVLNVNLGTTAISGSVVTPPVVTQPVVTTFGATGFSILNAATGAVIGTYSANATINLASLPTRNIAIIVNTTGPVGSVKISGMGKTVIENNAAYALFGNIGSQFFGWYAKAGTYNLTASTFSADQALGTTGGSKAITLQFV